jgi:hypothetical protein
MTDHKLIQHLTPKQVKALMNRLAQESYGMNAKDLISLAESGHVPKTLTVSHILMLNSLLNYSK